MSLTNMTYDFKDQIRDLEPGINMVLANQPIFLSLIGIGGMPVTQTKHEWMNDNINPDYVTFAAAALVGDTTLTLVAGNTDRVRVNAVITYKDELMQVTAVNSGANQITVVRGFDSTTAVSITANDTAKVVARPQQQGAGVGIDEAHDRTTEYNFTQIFERYAEVTGTQLAVNTYNVSNELDYQVQLRSLEIMREMNNTFLYGPRVQGSKGNPAMAGGILSFIRYSGAVRDDASSAALTEMMLNNTIEEVFKRGGRPDTIVCNTKQARAISAFNNGKIMIVRNEGSSSNQEIAGNAVGKFMGDLPGGVVTDIVIDTNMPQDKILLVERGRIKIHPMQGRGLRDMDATPPGSDFVARQIRGEYTASFKNTQETAALLEHLA